MAVRIEWVVDNGKMTPKFHYDHLLQYTGEQDMAPIVRHALDYLGKENITDMNPGIDVDKYLFEE